MRILARMFLYASLSLAGVAILPDLAAAQPPTVGAPIPPSPGIFCYKDVLGDLYKGVSKASEVSPRLEVLEKDKTCGKMISVNTATVKSVIKVGQIIADLSNDVTYDVYSLTLEFPNKQKMWALWAEDVPEVQPQPPPAPPAQPSPIGDTI